MKTAQNVFSKQHIFSKRHGFIDQRGFTLIEMIGVMAIIAILASVATPKILDAIQSSKISAYLAEAKNIKDAAFNYYKDTGRWPAQYSLNTANQYQNLMVKPASASIKGWNGPYLNARLANEITEGAAQYVFATNSTNYACDINGDGKQDGTFLIYRIDNVSDEIAKKISNIVDHDGDNVSGNNSWLRAGRIKRYAGKAGSILVYCLARV